MSNVTKNLSFEEILPWFGISGSVTLSEKGSTADFPAGSVARIIQTDQAVVIKFDWNTTGLLVPFLNGNWKASVFLEKMGGGEFSLPNNIATTPFVGSNPHTYGLEVHIPAGAMPTGVYKVVGSLNFTAPDGTPGPIAAFAELGMIQVYEA